jgi:Fe-S-cluster containining protein
MHVRALNKPAGQRCEHQTDQGCGNYEHRPEACRGWFCMWVRDTKGIFSDAHRPDRLGVFFTASAPDPLTRRQTLHAHEVSRGAAESAEARRVIQMLGQMVPVQIIPWRHETCGEPATKGERPVRLRGSVQVTVAGRSVN